MQRIAGRYQVKSSSEAAISEVLIPGDPKILKRAQTKENLLLMEVPRPNKISRLNLDLE